MSRRHGGALEERVSFVSEGETLVGTLRWPEPQGSGTRLPAVITSGSWTTVKEQMADLYARRLVRHGFATLSFDFRNWGQSGGQPRHFESPSAKIRDLHNAAEFLSAVDGVDPERIGALAICASAGYAVHAVAQGARISSLALVAAWLHDAATVGGFYGGDQGVRRRIEAGRAARARYESTGETEYVPAYDPDDPDAGMFFPLDYYANPERGAVPAWTNRLAVMTWPEWLQFDALVAAPSVRVPTLMVHGDDAALPANARRFFETLPGRKELLWTHGTQTDFYDQPPQVEKAVTLAALHFGETLGQP